MKINLLNWFHFSGFGFLLSPARELAPRLDVAALALTQGKKYATLNSFIDFPRMKNFALGPTFFFGSP